MLILHFILQYWLTSRQIKYLRAHINTIPPSFSEVIDKVSHQRAVHYTITKCRLAQIEYLWDSIILYVLSLGGGIAYLDRFIQHYTAHPSIAGISLIAAVLLLSGLCALPTTLYRTFVIEAKFGFNRTTLKTFVSDQLKTLLISALFGIPLIYLILWFIDTLGNFWWFAAWGLWMVFGLLMMLLYPSVIAPLFNRFTPLENAALQARIQRLLEQCGFSSQGVFVADGSRRSSHANAYFSGMGKSKRIVFFDTLIQRLETDEIEAVLAHELGHFKYHHLHWRMVWGYLLGLVLLGTCAWIMSFDAFYSAFKVTTPSAAVGLLLFFIWVPSFSFPLRGLSNALSRRHEFEADRFAATISSRQALIRGLVKLYRDNATPLSTDRWYAFYYHSHPAASTRIAALQ